MFSPEDLTQCLSADWFIKGTSVLERLTLRRRLGLGSDKTGMDEQTRVGLERFSQAVLGSVRNWDDPRTGISQQLCMRAADIEAGLEVLTADRDDQIRHSAHVFRAALLYDLLGMPSAAASLARKNGLPTDTKDFFARTTASLWGPLGGQYNGGKLNDRTATSDLAKEALAEVLIESARGFQYLNTALPTSSTSALNTLREIALTFSIGIDADCLEAVAQLLQLRFQHSTLNVLKDVSALSVEMLRQLRVPSELWPAQKIALQNGLLKKELKSFGLASPTGTGKTASARILIADFLNENRGSKVIYISPSRALSAQIARDLQEGLSALDITVLGLGGYLTFHQTVIDHSSADVLVFTPEKADLLLRIDAQTMNAVRLVIVDEAHHIEAGTRGILLEFYLWRLRAMLNPSARIVQLSAVTPNISELVSWLAASGLHAALQVEWRTNRLRLGVFEPQADGAAVVQFGNDAPFVLFKPGEFPEDDIAGLALLAHRLSASGTVLVLATSVAVAEKIAEAVGKLRQPMQEAVGENGERFDARVERELYSESPLRDLFKRRVAFHHAQLPPRVRAALEQLIADKQIDVVCATTTLAEGVNFPFSTVIVESLVATGYELSPRALWNIAGRAGRFGVDAEGHCILFRPSAWARRLKTFKLRDYMQAKLQDIPPVRSALGAAISELEGMVESQSIKFSELEKVNLSEVESSVTSGGIKRIRGLLNVLRVGYAHANASKTISIEETTAPEFEGDLLASRQMEPKARRFASRLAVQQRHVVRDALKKDDELVAIAARIGWSLETQNTLYEWLSTLEDWRLQQFGHIVRRGQADLSRLSFLIGPVAKRMAEFEGDTLGGFTSFVADKWIEGLPLTEIRNAQKTKPDFGRLVRVIYARVQYLLPWALYGVHELLQLESVRRKINVDDGVKDLSVLAAEGVPSFDALQLVLQLELERVDATRLAVFYQRSRQSTDMIGWFRNLPWETVVRIVRGGDRRRLDPDLRRIWEHVNKQ